MKKRPSGKPVFKENPPSCDWRSGPAKPGAAGSKSAIYRNRKGTFTWNGVRTESYKQGSGDWSRIVRRVLIGDSHRSRSHLRYFEIAPEGQSSHEKHNHEHLVVVLRGSGKVLLGEKNHTVRAFDVVHVASGTPHQFFNPFEEPFGFLCIVPSRRDKPKILKSKQGC